jgi:hypothetical protein
VRWLFDHVEAKERRRDASLAPLVPRGRGAERDRRVASWGRAATALGAFGILLVLAIGPAPDTAPLTVLFAVSVPLVLGGIVAWVVGVVRLGRRELVIRERPEGFSADPG